MISKGQGLILWFLALALSCILFLKGHWHSGNPGHAVAFSHATSAGIQVRIKGDVTAPGVYRLPDGSTVSTVIDMTLPPNERNKVPLELRRLILKSGSILNFRILGPESIEIKVYSMRAKERMTLGIPLQPDQMDINDWDAVPGIGPELARRIVNDRQKNGDFGTVEGLKRVPGIAEGKISRIRRFF